MCSFITMIGLNVDVRYRSRLLIGRLDGSFPRHLHVPVKFRFRQQDQACLPESNIRQSGTACPLHKSHSVLFLQVHISVCRRRISTMTSWLYQVQSRFTSMRTSQSLMHIPVRLPLGYICSTDGLFCLVLLTAFVHCMCHVDPCLTGIRSLTASPAALLASREAGDSAHLQCSVQHDILLPFVGICLSHRVNYQHSTPESSIYVLLPDPQCHGSPATLLHQSTRCQA